MLLNREERINLYVTMIDSHTDYPGSAYECRNRLEKMLETEREFLNPRQIQMGTEALDKAKNIGYPVF